MGVFQKNGSWWIDYRANGRRKREKIGPAKALAVKVLAKRQVEIAEGRFLDLKRQKHCLFSKAAERFLDYSKTNKRSFKRDNGIINNHLLPAFGNCNLDEITSWNVEEYKARRKKKVSPASVNRELACLKTIFNKAILWQMTKDNPVRGVRLLPENNRRIRYLLPEEIRLLIDACASYLKPIVITALNTGMRKGEILGLIWDDVDFRRGQILVRHSKNGESRVLEMNTLLSEILRQVRKRPQFPQVFLGRNGRPVKSVRTAFDNACLRAGLSDFRFHDLRHTFASHLVMNGTNITTVKELLGHKTLQMTLRYSHLSQVSLITY
jgi:integrase